MRGRSGRLTAPPSAMIDDSRIGASIPHPSADAGGATAASALAPSAISFARQVEAASSFGAAGAGGGGSGAFAGAPNSGGRGGGNGGSSATALTGAHETPSANAASASASRQPGSNAPCRSTPATRRRFRTYFPPSSPSHDPPMLFGATHCACASVDSVSAPALNQKPDA